MNISGLKRVGLGTLGGGGGPGAPASERFVSWVTFPFFVSGLLASRRKPHLCWLQELSLPIKKKIKIKCNHKEEVLKPNLQIDSLDTPV